MLADVAHVILNRPMEISTNVRPPRFREVIQVPKKVSCLCSLVHMWCLAGMRVRFD
jgi:hypothetical protein